jgi:two-component system response regulator HydG
VAAGDQRPDSALAQLRGSDAAFRAAVDTAVRAARSDVSVLVVGETGTGKDVVARAVHEGSRRAAGPLVPLNCGAIPRELIGSELFGHVRGAFTGATEHRDGLFVHADGGTLFLDELGELPLELQPNLLRVLEVRRVRPIGGLGERAVDVRIVAATNRLDGLGTASSPLREDLYHRVASVVIELPPLRARRDDIVPLAVHFLAELAPRHGRRWLAPAAMDALLTHDWPGNVRELRQAMERAAAMTEETIGPQDLGLVRREPRPAVQRPAAPRHDGWASTTGATTASGCGELTRLEAVERELMAHALNRCGTMRAAARELGMPKSTFAEKAHRYGLRARG